MRLFSMKYWLHLDDTHRLGKYLLANRLNYRSHDLNVVESIEFLIEKMKKTKSNIEFLLSMNI